MASHARRATPRNRPRPAGPWRHGPVPVIGLVGGIGSGKSAAAAALAGLGAFVLDADRVGHALLDQRPVRDLVAARFGPGVVVAGPDGESPRVDRKALAAQVFSDPKALRDLEAILHPRMRKTFERAVARASRLGKARGVVLDAATAVNTVIQGSAADLIKRAMIAVDRRTAAAGLRARMLLQIHDELVFECPAGELDALAGVVRREMTAALDLDVPLKVDLAAGPNWLDVQPLP